MLTIAGILVITAFIVTILNALGRAPLWIAVLLLIIVHMLTLMPVGTIH